LLLWVVFQGIFEFKPIPSFSAVGGGLFDERDLSCLPDFKAAPSLFSSTGPASEFPLLRATFDIEVEMQM